jgi:hypothetical protein
MHVGYLDSLNEAPAYIVSAMDSNGGFEGNSGNPGYTTKSKAIINLAGGLNKTYFAGPGDKPSVNAQGSLDYVVPYICGDPNFGTSSFPIYVNVNLCGLGSLEPVYDSNGIYHMSHVFPGDGHVPWSTDPVKFNLVDSLVTVFLYNMVCTNVASVNEVNLNTEVKIYPNPASDFAALQSPAEIKDIVVYDETGRIVSQAAGLNRNNYEISTSRFGAGIYFVRISFVNENYSPVVKRIVVE